MEFALDLLSWPLSAYFHWRSWSDRTNAEHYNWLIGLLTLLVYIAPIVVGGVWLLGWLYAAPIVLHMPNMASLVWFAGSAHPGWWLLGSLAVWGLWPLLVGFFSRYVLELFFSEALLHEGIDRG